MVSLRSQSALSGDAAHGDAANSHGEVSSGPTPRRSGRLRTSGGTAATPASARAAPRSVRTRHLRPIQEEQAEVQQQEEKQEQQAPVVLASGRSARAAPRGVRRTAAASPKSPAAAAPPLQESEEGEEEQGGEGQGSRPLNAKAAVVDLLAEEMFAALNDAFGERAGSGSGADAAGEQQGDKVAAPEHRDSGSSSTSDGSDSEGDGLGSGVPRHLRWQPELTLPGTRGGEQPAAAGRPSSGPAVHAVRAGADGLHVPPPDERALLRAARKAAPDTAGKGWFDLPATQITEEVKRDMRLLRLRGALDPKAHYKKLDSTKFPKYFQLGTVVEGAADFYSGRLTNKQRKRTFADELMADEHLTEVRKKRFAKLQEERGRWAKKKGRKTSNERKKGPHHRPKH